jgi:F-type H+-transporting ATPase subunit b
MDVAVAILEIITFVVFLYVLWRFAGRLISNGLRQRSDRIEQALRAAEENQRRAAEAQRESQRQLDQAQVEAQTIIAAAQKAAEAQSQALMERAKSDADALVLRADATIQRERQAAVDELRREAGRLAVFAAGKVVSQGVAGENGRDLVDRAIADVEGKR